jgi:RimJ/RimL family protein N-acetyltransferase
MNEHPYFHSVDAFPEFIPDIIECFKENADALTNDFDADPIERLAADMKRCSKWYFALTGIDNVFGGVCFLDNWQGTPEHPHSCDLNGYTNKKDAYRSFIVINAIIELLFKIVKVERIGARIMTNNKLAKHTAVRHGFKLEGVERNATMKNGKPMDVCVYSILKGEYDGR